MERKVQTMRLFLTIGDLQLNPEYILATSGCLPTANPKSPVRIHVDQRVGTLFAGADHVTYTAGATSSQASIIELVGQMAIDFRNQWNAMAQTARTGGATG